MSKETLITTLTMNPAVDKSAWVERVMQNDKLRCRDPRRDPGGGGINCSRVLVRLGGATRAYYCAGGLTGDALQALLSRESVPERRIRVEEETRENLTVVERSAGHQYRFGMPGARLSEAEWKEALEALFEEEQSPPWVLASGSLPPGVPDDFYLRLGERARDAGSRFIVDTSGEALKMALEAKPHLIKPNVRELADLAGRKSLEGPDIGSEAQRLVSDGMAEIVVVSLGSGGALLATDFGIQRFSAPTVSVESRIGAGDSMTAAMVLHLAAGATPSEAVSYGVAAGSAAVITPGTELCRKEDVERLVESVEISGDLS
jgi:6-phosphofructokinase 2